MHNFLLIDNFSFFLFLRPLLKSHIIKNSVYNSLEIHFVDLKTGLKDPRC